MDQPPPTPSLLPPQPLVWYKLLACLVIIGCIGVWGISVSVLTEVAWVGLTSDNMATFVSALLWIVPSVFLAWNQYRATFLAQASAAKRAAFWGAVAAALPMLALLGSRHLWQFLLFVLVANTLLITARCNYLWYQALEKFLAAGGTLAEKSKSSPPVSATES